MSPEAATIPVTVVPDTRQKAKRAVHALFGPLNRVLKGRFKENERAERVCAVLVRHLIRRDSGLLGLAHLQPGELDLDGLDLLLTIHFDNALRGDRGLGGVELRDPLVARVAHKLAGLMALSVPESTGVKALSIPWLRSAAAGSSTEIRPSSWRTW